MVNRQRTEGGLMMHFSQEKTRLDYRESYKQKFLSNLDRET